MTDFKWFLLCIFGFILLIIGLSTFEFSIYSSCIRLCIFKAEYINSCKSECSRRKKHGNGSYEAGIIFLFFGSILALVSIRMVTRRLANNISFGKERNAKAELTEVVEVFGKTDTESASLQEQLRAQTAQTQAITERLSQLEELLQTRVQENNIQEVNEPRPLGRESKNLGSE